MSRRVGLVVLAVIAAHAGAAAAAGPVAATTADVPISAGQGWLVWSAPAPGGWELMGSHGGLVARIPVAPRAFPFDVDVGTDRKGRPVAVFSRCDRYAAQSSPG